MSPVRSILQPAPVDRASWHVSADALRRHQLGQLAALFVEAASPLAFLASQALYIGAPFLGSRATRLARILESESGMSKLVHYLETGTENSRSSDGPRP